MLLVGVWNETYKGPFLWEFGFGASGKSGVPSGDIQGYVGTYKVF